MVIAMQVTITLSFVIEVYKLAYPFLVKWSKKATPIILHNFKGPQPGPRVPVSSDPLSVFDLYFTEDNIDLIVQETNRYAEQVLAAKGSDKQWSTNAQEIRAYFGFTILMGINRLPELRDYWSTNPNLHYAPITGKISRDHFEEITRYLHSSTMTCFLHVVSQASAGYRKWSPAKPFWSWMILLGFKRNAGLVKIGMLQKCSLTLQK